MNANQEPPKVYRKPMELVKITRSRTGITSKLQFRNQTLKIRGYGFSISGVLLAEFLSVYYQDRLTKAWADGALAEEAKAGRVYLNGTVCIDGYYGTNCVARIADLIGLTLSQQYIEDTEDDYWIVVDRWLDRSPCFTGWRYKKEEKEYFSEYFS